MTAEHTMHPELFLGIDAGGSKTEAWLAWRNPGPLELIGKGIAGPANLTVGGLEKAGQQILAATARAFSAANLSRTPILRSCLCMAGCGRSEERQQVQQWALTQRLGREILVCSDAEILLAATRPIESAETVAEGIGLIAGTGSIAWGRAKDGRLLRCGGWGPLLGDEGSGYAIAQAALKAVCGIADGRESDPILLNTILSTIGLDATHQIIPWAYAAERSREEIARLSATVFEISDVSSMAQQIIQQAAEQLAQQVATLVCRLQFSEYLLAMAGGVLVNQVSYRDLVHQQLRRLSCEPCEFAVVKNPVRGALRLASLPYLNNP